MNRSYIANAIRCSIPHAGSPVWVREDPEGYAAPGAAADEWDLGGFPGAEFAAMGMPTPGVDGIEAQVLAEELEATKTGDLAKEALLGLDDEEEIEGEDEDADLGLDAAKDLAKEQAKADEGEAKDGETDEAEAKAKDDKTDKTEKAGKPAKVGLVSELVRMRQRAQRAEGQLGAVNAELASVREANAKVFEEFGQQIESINDKILEALDGGDREAAKELNKELSKVQIALARHSGTSASHEQALAATVTSEDTSLLGTALDQFITAYPSLNPENPDHDVGAVSMINALYNSNKGGTKTNTSAFIDAVETVVQRLNIEPAGAKTAPAKGTKAAARAAAAAATVKQDVAARTPPAPASTQARDNTQGKLASIARMTEEEFDSVENRKNLEETYGIRMPK